MIFFPLTSTSNSGFQKLSIGAVECNCCPEEVCSGVAKTVMQMNQCDIMWQMRSMTQVKSVSWKKCVSENQGSS